MKLLLSFACAAALVGPGLALRDPDPALEGFRWRTDLEAARAEAVASGHPLLVVFR
jgi:hypothetical protein